MKSRRTAALDDALLTAIADGETLRRLCVRHGLARATVYNWMREDEDFARAMAWARAVGFDAIAEETLDIADEAPPEQPAPQDENANPTAAPRRRKAPAGEAPPARPAARQQADAVARAKLRIDTRLRLLDRWDPKRYGDAQAGLAGLGGLAGLIGSPDAAPDAGRAVEPVAIAARLASLLTLVAARDPAAIGPDFPDDFPPDDFLPDDPAS